MKMPIDKEWYEKRAAAEGDHKIGVGGNRKTMTLNLTDEEIAELEQLIDPRGAALRKAAAEVVRCRHDPYGNFAAAMRDLEAALGPSPSPNLVGEPVGEIVAASTPAAEMLYGRDVKFYEAMRTLPIGTKLYAGTVANHEQPAAAGPDLDAVSLRALRSIHGSMFEHNLRLAHGYSRTLPDGLTEAEWTKELAGWQLVIRDALLSVLPASEKTGGNTAEETVKRLRYALENCVSIMKMCRQNCVEDELVRAYLKDGMHVAETALAALTTEGQP